MTKVPRLLLACVSVLAAASAAASADLAQDLSAPVQPVVVETSGGFYLGTINSLTFIDNTRFATAGARVSTDYDVGYYSALRAGYSFGDVGYVSPRLELEVGYGNSSVDHHRVNGADVGSTDSFGDATTIQGYVNGYLDIPLGSPEQGGFFSAVTPYVGGGVGFMNLELGRQGVSGTGVVIDDDDTQFAYHLDAGVGIDLQGLGLFSDVSLFNDTTLDIGYRYTAADDFSVQARDGTNRSTDFSSHAVMFGFRKQF
ncbi:outer membrane protein [Pararhizobium sp. DWP3-4]|uniref:outer membrane protein n=1 Tax=unclassified Pararhizobium TaxID=2643050 RepID=UPI003CF77FD0